jgi:hypothetical protein
MVLFEQGAAALRIIMHSAQGCTRSEPKGRGSRNLSPVSTPHRQS